MGRVEKRDEHAPKLPNTSYHFTVTRDPGVQLVPPTGSVIVKSALIWPARQATATIITAEERGWDGECMVALHRDHSEMGWFKARVKDEMKGASKKEGRILRIV